MKKTRDLGIITLIYIAAYAAGYLCCLPFEGEILRFFIFDAAATVVTFAFSTALRNSSVYDAYWSLTPMVMSIWLFIGHRAFSAMQVIFLIAFNIWGARLTLNWVTVFTGFDYEDWRYRKYRNETPKLLWPIVNFWGIHMIPTLVVFAGMLPLFVIAESNPGVLSLAGIAVMLTGVYLEHAADTAMHRFLNERASMNVCREGLWKYSRHPNYLGEITFWLGVYMAMLPCAAANLYHIIGFISVAVLFNVVSIPLMEKRQLTRRPEYASYMKETARLLPLRRR